jgi:hypothetical protein
VQGCRGLVLSNDGLGNRHVCTRLRRTQRRRAEWLEDVNIKPHQAQNVAPRARLPLVDVLKRGGLGGYHAIDGSRHDF